MYYRKYVSLLSAAIVFSAALLWGCKAAPKEQTSNNEGIELDLRPWYEKYHIIRHSCGGIDGKIFTDSMEAIEYSYDKGCRVYDADMNMTSDNHIVLRHNWGDNLEEGSYTIAQSFENGLSGIDANGEQQIWKDEATPLAYEDFMNSAIFGKLTPVDMEMMFDFMDEHNDVYFSCDMKGDLKSMHEQLLDYTQKIHKEYLLDRIIVNAYNEDEYNTIMSVYDWKNVVMRHHYIVPNEVPQLVDFCILNDIHVVNSSKCYLNDEDIKLFEENNIKVYGAVINYQSEVSGYISSCGLDGCVSDWLTEDDWAQASKN